jgi:fructose-1,6-bisphosphatase II / sedoheptulose-1,7-bisphosphatase
LPLTPIVDEQSIERFLALALARVTERAAVAAARLRGRGDEMAADEAAARTMRAEMERLPFRGRVVIGEDEHAAAMFVGEEIGEGDGPLLDLAVAPLEGATLCAKDMPGAISVVAIANAGSLLHAPDVYMDKIAIGPGYPPGLVDLDREPGENIAALARAKNVDDSDIVVCILDRPRHAELIAKCRRAGASVRLISDGDVAGVIFTAQPAQTGVDMYLGRAARRKACWRRGRCAAWADKCRGASCSTRRPKSREPPRWGFRTRAKNTICAISSAAM